jgi:hypothetical protein
MKTRWIVFFAVLAWLPMSRVARAMSGTVTGEASTQLTSGGAIEVVVTGSDGTQLVFGGDDVLYGKFAKLVELANAKKKVVLRIRNDHVVEVEDAAPDIQGKGEPPC